MNDVPAAQTLLAGRIAAAGLGLVAGFVDAFGYFRWHAFGANMTGNTVIFAISLYKDAASALLPLTLILAFVAGSVLGRAIVDRAVPAAGLVTEAVLLTAAAFTPGNAALALITLAMGVQNASIGKFAGVRANTAFITGDYGNLGQAIGHLIIRGGSDDSLRTLSILSPLIAAYATGALIAAGCSALRSSVLLVVPVVLVLAYAVHRGALK
jgi:uncharacterized membrane protein YoaK (UPF0700 family)